MKKIYIILSAFLMIALTSCKDNMTVISCPDDASYVAEADKSFETEMKALWEGLNMSYVFWDIDSTDWDAWYDEMINRGREYDALAKEGRLDWSDDDVQERLTEPFFTLIDHHMGVTIVNPYITDAKERGQEAISFSPGAREVQSRDYYYKPVDDKRFFKTFNKMLGERAVNVQTSAYKDKSGSETYLLSAIIDGTIPYLHMSGYDITAIMSDDTATVSKEVLNDFFSSVKQLYDNKTLKGVILDNRFNGGGSMADLDYVVGLYINEPVDLMQSRTKVGLGRYDYGNWKTSVENPYTNSDYYVGDLGDVPYIVLQNIHSVSMAELSSNVISRMHNGVTIGDRTFGGNGTLSTSYTYAQNGYNGSFSQQSVGVHGIYTPNTMAMLLNKKTDKWEVMEGIGLNPDIECDFDISRFVMGYDNQLNRALNYIENKQ